jgi:hypothetical protein
MKYLFVFLFLGANCFASEYVPIGRQTSISAQIALSVKTMKAALKHELKMAQLRQKLQYEEDSWAVDHVEQEDVESMGRKGRIRQFVGRIR